MKYTIIAILLIPIAFLGGYYFGSSNGNSNKEEVDQSTVNQNDVDSSWYMQTAEELHFGKFSGVPFKFNCDNEKPYKIAITSNEYSYSEHDGQMDGDKLFKSIFVYGWSKDGSALAVSLGNNTYSLEWQVWDVLTDKVRKTVGGYYEAGCESFESDVRNMFVQSDIIENGTKFYSGSKIHWDQDYELRIEGGILYVFANDGEKEVAKKIAKVEGEILGYFKSPLEKRIAVLVGSLEHGFEMETEFITTLHGCLLKHSDFN